jgi:uncharacterized protein (TIGR03086 family)
MNTTNDTTPATGVTRTPATETPAERFRRLADHFDSVVAAVPADAWDRPSPCEGWTVADVVGHVASTQREFLERQGLPAGEVPEGAGAVEQWRVARAAMQAAVDDPAIAGTTYDGYFGPTTIGETVDAFYAMDLAVHGWDVARGAGLSHLERLHPDDVAHAQAKLSDIAGDTVRMAGIFGDPVEVPADASEQDRFLAWTGRRP